MGKRKTVPAMKTNNQKKVAKKIKHLNPTSTITKTTTTSTIHPPHSEMINEAIATLQETTGSSQQAISKFMEGKYGSSLPKDYKKNFSTKLKQLAKEGKITAVKNSYKISKTTSTAKMTKKGATTRKSKVKVKDSSEAESSTPFTDMDLDDSTAVKVFKLKRLSQVKTPEALEKNAKQKKSVKK